jgi:hypothetical protein
MKRAAARGVVVGLATGEQQDDREGVGERHLRELVREGADDGEIAGVDRAAEVRADMPLARHRCPFAAHEHTFVA